VKTTFYDRQDGTNPMNGFALTNASELRWIFSAVRGRRPFFAELMGDNGYKLLIGLGDDRGCIQFSSEDGSPPYYMAVAPKGLDSTCEISFLIGDTLSPVPGRFGLPYQTLVHVAEQFVNTGQRSNDVLWEDI
jgi:immunity protein Imm1 of predicted polymorphic toxin system